MKGSRLFAWTAFAIGALYFFLPLIGTFEFSLRMIRGKYSFEAYRVVFADPRFRETFAYSTALALATIVVGVLIVAQPAPRLCAASVSVRTSMVRRPLSTARYM